MSFKIKHSSKFVTMPVYHLRDTELSLFAKGLMSWFFDADGWNGDFADILKFHRGITQTHLITALNELQAGGYITVDGKSNYIVNEKPANVRDKVFKPIELDDEANKESKPKKNLFQKCSDFVDEYTQDINLRRALKSYLYSRLSPGKDSRFNDRPLGNFASWRSLVLTLDAMEGDKVKIVDQSNSKQWAKFVDIPHNQTLDKVQNGAYTKEEIEMFRKRAKEIEENGGQGIF